MTRAILVVLLLLSFACITNNLDGPTPVDIPEPMPPLAGLTVQVDEGDRIFVEQLPHIVVRGEENVYRDSIDIDIDDRVLREVFIFHGIDTSDVVEMDTNVYLDDVPIWLRSDHGFPDGFDAWGQPMVVERPRPGDNIHINITCRVTGVNTIFNRFAARPHWGIWLTFE